MQQSHPMQVARYRERHSTSGAKSDAADAHVLAEIVRLDRGHHRAVAGDSPDPEAMKLVARTHRSLIWDRSRRLLRLRSALREFFPAAVEAFDDLAAPEVLERLWRRCPSQDGGRCRQAVVPQRLRVVAGSVRSGSPGRPSPAAAWGFPRRRTATSWRSTSSSASLDAVQRASSASQLMSRTKIR